MNALTVPGVESGVHGSGGRHREPCALRAPHGCQLLGLRQGMKEREREERKYEIYIPED